MTKYRVVLFLLVAGGLAVLCPPPAGAANGMNLIGYGAESVAMGGSDLAITNSPSSMNINPAGIGWCTSPQIDFGLAVMDPDIEFSDQIGNDTEDNLPRYPMPLLGYVQPVKNVTWGVGLFVQGGLGARYEDLVTPPAAMAASGMFPPGFFGTSVIPPTDDVLSRVTHLKLTPSVAWRVSSSLTVGATLNVSYATAEMKLFPNTSVLADLDMSGTVGDSPRDRFSGMYLDGLSALGYGLRVGAQYRHGGLSIGGAYTTETDLEFDGGSMELNLSAMGLGKVAYDAEIDGFHWPQRAGLGIAYQFTPRFLMAVDVDWIDWSSAIRSLEIRIDDPQNPAAPSPMQVPFQMDWEDQWVYALGFEVNVGTAWAARFGYNQGDSPIPAETMRPQFPAIAEDHVTAGFGYTTGAWDIDFALEYALENEETNDNPDPTVNPFGPGSTLSLSQLMAHLTVRYRFGSKG